MTSDLCRYCERGCDERPPAHGVPTAMTAQRTTAGHPTRTRTSSCCSYRWSSTCRSYDHGVPLTPSSQPYTCPCLLRRSCTRVSASILSTCCTMAGDKASSKPSAPGSARAPASSSTTSPPACIHTTTSQGACIQLTYVPAPHHLQTCMRLTCMSAPHHLHAS